MMIGVHHNLEAARRLNSMTVHGLPDRIYVGGPPLAGRCPSGILGQSLDQRQAARIGKGIDAVDLMATQGPDDTFQTDAGMQP